MNGGLGGLGGFDPGNALGAIGMALLSSPRNAPLQNLPTFIQAANKNAETVYQTKAMEEALVSAGIPRAEAQIMARNPEAAKIRLQLRQEGRQQGAYDDLVKKLGNAPSIDGAPTPAPAAPVGPRSDAGSPLDAARSAIANVESGGGNYAALGPVTRNGDRAYGAYQVMGANIGPWTEKHLGRRLTPQEFLASKEAQDAVFNGEFGSYLQKYGNVNDAASMWFSGRPMAQAGNRSDGYNTVPQYVEKVNRALGGAQAAPTQTAAPGPAPDWQTAQDSPETFDAKLARARGGSAGLSIAPVPAPAEAGSAPAAPTMPATAPLPPVRPAGLGASPSAPQAPAIDPNSPDGGAKYFASMGMDRGPTGPVLTPPAPMAVARDVGQVTSPVAPLPAPPPAPPSPPPRAADLPVENAVPAQGQAPVAAPVEPRAAQMAERKVESAVGEGPPPPPNTAKGESTQRAAALRYHKYWGDVMVAAGNPALGDKGKMIAERAKQEMQLAHEFLKPTDIQRQLDALNIPAEEKQRILRNAVDDKRPTSIKEAEYVTANPTMKDTVVEMKRADKPETTIKNYANPIVKGISDQFLEDRAAAKAAVTETRAIHEARNLLDQGIFTGPGANIKLAMGRIGTVFGFGKDVVANTESFGPAVAQRVLPLVKGLGAGSGISNADREFAEKMAGSQIKMTEQSLRQILDIGERAARAKVTSYNEAVEPMVKNADEELRPFASTLRVPEPPEYKAPEKAGAAQKPSAPLALPTRGEVRDGYRFLGGDPANPKSLAKGRRMSGPWEAYQTPAALAPEGPWTAYQAGAQTAEAPAGPYIGSPNFRLSTILRHVFDTAKSGATLPGDVYAGRVDPTSEEGIERAADLAMFATPVAPKAVPRAAAPSAPAAAAPARAEIAAAAENVGMEIPRVALMPSWVQKVGAGISDLPVIGAPLQRSAEKALGQAEQRVGETAFELGAASREGAGAGVQAGVQRFKTDTIPQIEREAYAPVNAALKPEGYTPKFPASETASALGEIQARLERSGGALGGEAARVARMLEQGKVDFQALQDARSALGAQMRDKLNRQGYDDWADARLYGALSRDMEGAAKTVGGDELAGALRSANAQTRDAWEQFKTVAPLGRENASPNAVFEQVFGLAMDKRGDLNKLATLRKTIGPEEWGNVAATAIERMGKNNSDQFSMQFFLSNYDKMNPSARTLLFGEARKSIDDLATSFRALQGIERFKSKSQSANPMTVAATFAAGGGAFAEPFTTATALLSSYAGARWLAKPAAAEAMARWAKNYEILVRRPSEGLAKSALASAKRFGAVSAAELGMPSAANDLAAPLLDATRQVLGGMKRPAADAPSGRALPENEQENR